MNTETLAPTVTNPSTFEALGLADVLLRSVRAEGYTEPTPIQTAAVPHVLAGRDVLGCAQTGTGKTAAFALPMLQRLAATPRQARGVRALVLSPTRELAAQIGESFTRYGSNTRLTNTVIFGGVGQDAQIRALRGGVDILVATPGRLLDLLQQNIVSFSAVEIFVLDEADRMLDMGFLPDVRRVVAKLPRKRQTLFFSATMPADIQALADSMLVDPAKVAVTPVASTAERIEQSVYLVEKRDKRALLEHVLQATKIDRALVFTRTKHGADRVVKHLLAAGIGCAAIHGNKSQPQRTTALQAFRDGRIRILVATDIAARGIDVSGVSHVFNFELPNVAEQYVHRIGRTARAGATGIAISFVDEEERAYLRGIERLTRVRLEPMPLPEDFNRRKAALPKPTQAPPTAQRRFKDSRAAPAAADRPKRPFRPNRSRNGVGAHKGAVTRTR